jgi:hypothetical protein
MTVSLHLAGVTRGTMRPGVVESFHVEA